MFAAVINSNSCTEMVCVCVCVHASLRASVCVCGGGGGGVISHLSVQLFGNHTIELS